MSVASPIRLSKVKPPGRSGILPVWSSDASDAVGAAFTRSFSPSLTLSVQCLGKESSLFCLCFMALSHDSGNPFKGAIR